MLQKLGFIWWNTMNFFNIFDLVQGLCGRALLFDLLDMFVQMLLGLQLGLHFSRRFFVLGLLHFPLEGNASLALCGISWLCTILLIGQAQQAGASCAWTLNREKKNHLLYCLGEWMCVLLIQLTMYSAIEFVYFVLVTGSRSLLLLFGLQGAGYSVQRFQIYCFSSS